MLSSSGEQNPLKDISSEQPASLPEHDEQKREVEIKADLGSLKLKDLAGKNIVVFISVLKGLRAGHPGLTEKDESKLVESTLSLFSTVQRLLQKKSLKPVNVSFVLGGGTGPDYPMKRELTEKELKDFLHGLKTNANQQEFLEHAKKHFLKYAQNDEKDYLEQYVVPAQREAQRKAEFKLDCSVKTWLKKTQETEGFESKSEIVCNRYKDSPEFTGEVDNIRDGFILRRSKGAMSKKFGDAVLLLRPDLAGINFETFFNQGGADFLLSEYSLLEAIDTPTILLYSGKDFSEEFKTAFVLNKNIKSGTLSYKKIFPLEQIESKKLEGFSTPYDEEIVKPQSAPKVKAPDVEKPKSQLTPKIVELEKKKKSVLRENSVFNKSAVALPLRQSPAPDKESPKEVSVSNHAVSNPIEIPQYTPKSKMLLAEFLDTFSMFKESSPPEVAHEYMRSIIDSVRARTVTATTESAHQVQGLSRKAVTVLG